MNRVKPCRHTIGEGSGPSRSIGGAKISEGRAVPGYPRDLDLEARSTKAGISGDTCIKASSEDSTLGDGQ